MKDLDKRRARSRRRFRRTLFAVFVTVSFFILLEAALRFVSPPAENLRLFHGADIFDLDLMWIPDALTSTERGRHLAERPFNDEMPIPLSKPEDALRIICMGGSVTKGFTCGPEEAYPRRIQDALRERYDLPLRVEVLNAGCFGGNSYMGQFMFDQILRRYSPDVVTVLYTVNDRSPSASIGLFMTDRRYVETHRRIQRFAGLRTLRDFFQRQCTYQLLCRGVVGLSRLASRRETFPEDGLVPARVPPEDFARNLDRFADMAEEDGFELVLMYEAGIGGDDPVAALGRGSPYWKAMEGVARERGVVFLEPGEALNNQPRPRREYFLDGCHMTGEGLGLFGERVAADLVASRVIERAIARR